MKKKLPPLLWIGEQLKCFDAQMSRAGSSSGAGSGLDLEARISLSLRLHEMVEDVEKSWGTRVQAGEIVYMLEDAERIQALYGVWLKGAMRVWKQVQRAEGKGARLAMAERLKDTIGFCYQPRIDIKKTNETFERLERGEGVVVTGGAHGVRRRRAS